MAQSMSFWNCIKGALSGVRPFLASESPLKIMKNAFYFTLKAFFFLKIIYIFSLTFGPCRKNGLIRKIRLISKFMTSQSGQQTVVIHILPNISRSRDNQTMTFGQLIKYNMRNIFLQKSYTECGTETRPKLVQSFSEKLILSISLGQ